MQQRYRVTRLIASGGMAEIYLGVSVGAEGFEKPVAIKRVLPHLAANPDIARMFLSEAAIARHLHHQNIVAVSDVGRNAEGLFLVMEAVNGWDLRVIQRANARRGLGMPPELAVYIAAQVNAGLVHAYGKRVEGKAVVTAHRDVSDSNILISREGEVKVADFGIARAELVSNNTEPGTFKGRLSYAAPELLRSQPATAASDQFALGIVLVELIAGAAPWGDPSENLGAYIHRVETEPPKLDSIPPTLAPIVTRMLSRDPAARFAPVELSRALSAWLAASGVPVGPHELADFVGGLDLPPPALELETEGAVAPPNLGFGGEAFSFANDLALTEEPWMPTGGPVMDASGHIEAGTSGLELERAAPAVPLASFTPPRESRVPPKTDGAPLLFGATSPGLELGRDMEKEASARVDSTPSGFQFGEPAPKSGGPLKLIVALLVLGALVAGGVFAWPMIQKSLRHDLPTLRGTPMLRIDSEPSGAAVLIDGNSIGETPLAIDNAYPKQPIPFELSLSGFERFHGTFQGGEEQAVEAKLKRSGPSRHH